MLRSYLVQLFVAIACFFVPAKLTAAGDPPFTYLGIENGLSNNSVTCITQDQSGFMWFGTYDGLNRYDGYGFKSFRNQLNNPRSLPDNRIMALAVDVFHKLWVGTRNGVARYDQVTATFESILCRSSPGKPAGKINAIVNDICPDKTGNVFIASDAGLLRYDQQLKIAIPVGLKDNAISPASLQAMSVDIDDQQRIWVYVRERGIFSFNPKNQELELVNASVKNGICLKADPQGRFWIGTDDGLYLFEPASGKLSKELTSGNRIVQLSRYGSKMYIASDGNGIFVYDYGRKIIQPLITAGSQRKLTSVCVYAVKEDRDGRLWVATLRGGINVLDPGKNKFHTVAHDPLQSNSLVDNFVTSVAEDPGGNLWIGTDGNGISYWNRRDNVYKSYRPGQQTPDARSGNFITRLLPGQANDLWVATWGGGVYRLNKAKDRFEHFSCFNPEMNKEDKASFLLYRDLKNNLWVGTCLEGGLYRFNAKRNIFELYDARLKNILTLYEDKKGNFWGGDFSTLIRIDTVNKQHQRFAMGHAIRAIVEDQQGNFWVGTEGGGLLLFNAETGKFNRYTEANGLTNNAILQMLQDKKGNLWISTFNGISYFDTRKRKFRNFSQADGLQSNQFTYNAALKLQNGEFVFGGIKGLSIFYPDSVLNRQQPLSVLITGLKVDNKPLNDSSGYIAKRSDDKIECIRLPYEKAAVAVDFVALNYSGSDMIRYAYFLEGWDKGWNYVGRTRSANYTRLTEGTYTLRVKALDAAGIWSGWNENLSIIILPPWYRSWWAYLLYSAFGVGLIYAFVQYKAQQARQSYEIALAKIETEKEKELNEKKLSFFTNISHEFRAPLTLIIDPVKELLYHPEKKAGEGLHLVYRNARRLLSLVDQLLLFRKADAERDQLKTASLNFYELCHEVFMCFSQQARARNIQYEFFGDNSSLQLSVDREKMEVILFNLLSNALKFTAPGGIVTLTLLEKTEGSKNVEVQVTDTGCGIVSGTGDLLFDKFYQVNNGQNGNQKGFGIGLYLVKQFTEAHRGSITYTSILGQGTSFTLTIPTNLPATMGTASDRQDWTVSTGRKPMLVEELMADLEASTAGNYHTDRLVQKNPDPLPHGIPDIISEKKSILVVDDDAAIREYLNHIFQDRYLVFEAADGERGLALAEAQQPDIIISDVIMKGMTGIDFCNRIKADPELNHIPVILLTATTTSDIKLKGIECGAEDYITKPFERELLIARVENILKNRNTIQQYFLDTVTLRKSRSKVSAVHRDFLDKCIQVIEKEIENENFTIKSFAREMGMSHSSLYKKVKSVSGLSLNAFIRLLRLRKAALLLLRTNTNINEAAFQVGINDSKYFRLQFHKLYGMNPSDYVKKYKDSFNRDFNFIG